MNTQTMRLSILAASMIFLGCGAVERVKYVQRTGDKPEWTPNCESTWVKQGGQWPCDVHLTLSVYWTTKSDYTENFKVKIKNRDLVANLKVSLYGKTREAFKSKNFIVRAGQQLEWEGYSIYIEEIRLWPRLFERVFGMREGMRVRVRRIEPAEFAPEVPAGNSQPQAPAKE